MSKRKLVYFLVLCILVLFLIKMNVEEGFVEAEGDKLKSDINSAMTVFADVLCPTYNVILKDLQSDPAALEKQAGGAVFVCPPPLDPAQIPANIDERIQRTIAYFLKKLETGKKDILTSMNRCEGFQPIQNTVNIAEISEQQKLEILKARHAVLTNLLNQKQIPEQLAKIKSLSEELLSLKQKAESGELKPNC